MKIRVLCLSPRLCPFSDPPIPSLLLRGPTSCIPAVVSNLFLVATWVRQENSAGIFGVRVKTPASLQIFFGRFYSDPIYSKRAVDGTINSIDEIIVQLDAIKDVLKNSTADWELYERAHSIRNRVKQQRDHLEKNDTLSAFGVNGEMAVSDRLWHARYAPTTNAYGPTDTQRQSFIIARDTYADIGTQLTQLVDGEYAALKDTLDSSSVPWTPGRGIMK